ncbi:hypothetical protein DVH05_019190 [Phytophthora capsici]|nr:hypothetical protein DVH05_019190 [Phytophthora capsici]
MIVSDCFHMVVALRTIYIKVNIVKKQRNYEGTEIQEPLDYFRDLPGMIREVFGDSEISKARSCRIRVFAPFPLSLSDESISFMNDVARTRRYVHIYASSAIQLSDQTRRESISRGRATGRLSEIGGVGALTMFTESKVLVPLNQRQERPLGKQSLHLLLKARFASRKGSAPRRLLTLMHSDTKIASHTLRAVLSHNTTEEAVWDALQVHFHSEYLLMTEYIECTLPIFYVVYLLVLSQLPVAPYYANIASQTSEQLTKTIVSLTILSVVELAGFLGLLVLLRDRFGFLPLYQLAFVLETQVRTLQGHLFVWSVFILHLPLVHYGK